MTTSNILAVLTFEAGLEKLRADGCSGWFERPSWCPKHQRDIEVCRAEIQARATLAAVRDRLVLLRDMYSAQAAVEEVLREIAARVEGAEEETT